MAVEKVPPIWSYWCGLARGKTLYQPRDKNSSWNLELITCHGHNKTPHNLTSTKEKANEDLGFWRSLFNFLILLLSFFQSSMRFSFSLLSTMKYQHKTFTTPHLRPAVNPHEPEWRVALGMQLMLAHQRTRRHVAELQSLKLSYFRILKLLPSSFVPYWSCTLYTNTVAPPPSWDPTLRFQDIMVLKEKWSFIRGTIQCKVKLSIYMHGSGLFSGWSLKGGWVTVATCYFTNCY